MPVQAKYFQKEGRKRQYHKQNFLHCVFGQVIFCASGMTQMSRELTEPFCAEGPAGGGVLAEFSHVPLLFASMDKIR